MQPIIDLMQSPRSPYTYTRTTPLGPGTPRDVGDLAVFLASDEGRFFTGSTLTPTATSSSTDAPNLSQHWNRATNMAMLSDEDHHRSARWALPARKDPRG